MSTSDPVSVFAFRRGKLIKRAREEANMSQGELADLLGMTRNNLSMLESGRIDKITEQRCRILMERLGLNPTELWEKEPEMLGKDFLPEASFEARRIGRMWDSLPPSLKEYILAQIETHKAMEDRRNASDQESKPGE